MVHLKQEAHLLCAGYVEYCKEGAEAAQAERDNWKAICKIEMRFDITEKASPILKNGQDYT